MSHLCFDDVSRSGKHLKLVIQSIAVLVYQRLKVLNMAGNFRGSKRQISWNLAIFSKQGGLFLKKSWGMRRAMDLPPLQFEDHPQFPSDFATEGDSIGAMRSSPSIIWIWGVSWQFLSQGGSPVVTMVSRKCHFSMTTLRGWDDGNFDKLLWLRRN